MIKLIKSEVRSNAKRILDFMSKGYDFYESDKKNYYFLKDTGTQYIVYPYKNVDQEFLEELEWNYKTIYLYFNGNQVVNEKNAIAAGFNRSNVNFTVWKFRSDYGYFSEDTKYNGVALCDIDNSVGTIKLPVHSYYEIVMYNGDLIRCTGWTQIKLEDKKFKRVDELKDQQETYKSKIDSIREIKKDCFMFNISRQFTIGETVVK